MEYNYLSMSQLRQAKSHIKLMNGLVITSHRKLWVLIFGRNLLPVLVWLIAYQKVYLLNNRPLVLPLTSLVYHNSKYISAQAGGLRCYMLHDTNDCDPTFEYGLKWTLLQYRRSCIVLMTLILTRDWV